MKAKLYFFGGNEQDAVEYLGSCQNFSFPTEKVESCLMYQDGNLRTSLLSAVL